MQIVICSTHVSHTCSRFGRLPSHGTSGALTMLNCLPFSSEIVSMEYDLFGCTPLDGAAVPLSGWVGVAPLQPGIGSLSSTRDCRLCICCSLSCSNSALAGTGYFLSISANCRALCSSLLHNCTTSTSRNCSGPRWSWNTLFSTAICKSTSVPSRHLYTFLHSITGDSGICIVLSKHRYADVMCVVVGMVSSPGMILSMYRPKNLDTYNAMRRSATAVQQKFVLSSKYSTGICDMYCCRSASHC